MVTSVGPGVTAIERGDRVALCVPVPPCRVFDPDLRRMTYLCHRGSLTGFGRQISDGTARHHARCQDLGGFLFSGTFADYAMVNEASCLRVSPDLSSRDICTISRAGATGWWAVQNTGALRPGETVVVIGVGDIGADALWPRATWWLPTSLAIDPSERALAVTYGADRAAADIASARDELSEWTRGAIADVAIMSIASRTVRVLGDASSLVGKRGRVVVVNAHPDSERTATVSLRDLQSLEKHICGCLAGSWHGRKGPRFLLRLAERAGSTPAPSSTPPTNGTTSPRLCGLDRRRRTYAESCCPKAVHRTPEVRTDGIRLLPVPTGH